MNKELSPLWTHLTSEHRLTGTWRAALPTYQDQPSPCLGACPVNGNIAVWIKQIKDGDMRGAFETLAENNPFPAIAGRICHHPCETACNRVELDETVGICSLERHVGDTALAQNWALPTPATELSQKIAVVGGGPAGLSAAYQLRRRGFQVSIYEAGDGLGGLLRTGIPSYRLSRDVLKGEIDRIINMGIQVHLNAEVKDQVALKELHNTYDAVFLATGASQPKHLPGLDYDQPFVMDSADFLAAPEAEQGAKTGAHVLVIGGGSAAMDVARSARRLGREVTVLTLEAEGRLPAQQVELDEAAEEGVKFVSGAMLKSAHAAGEVIEIACVKVDFVPANQSASAQIAAIDKSDFTLTANTIIPAIGQDADLDRWADLLSAEGPVLAAAYGGQTNVNGLYAGGDVASMERFVTQAIGMGKEAAKAIAAELETTHSPPAPLTDPLVDYKRINTAYQDRHARTPQGNTEAADRLSSFDEVQHPLSTKDAQTEAARCFTCGTCIYCDNCYFYCPDMAITKLDNGYEVKTDYCKGCGLCVAECPTGSIHMQEDSAQ